MKQDKDPKRQQRWFDPDRMFVIERDKRRKEWRERREAFEKAQTEKDKDEK